MGFPVAILSKNSDFSAVLAEQLQRELSLDSAVAENAEAAKKLSPLLIVSSEPAEKFGCPVIAVKMPVRLRELLAEVEQALQKLAVPEDNIVLGAYRLQCRAKQLTHTPSRKTVDLTDKEIQLLQALADAGAKGVSKEQLLKSVWGIEAALETHTLETHIYRLRGKLKELADEDVIIAIENGYKLKL